MILRTLASGFVGSAALTALHQVGKRVLPDAPRLDQLGERAVSQGLHLLGMHAPRGKKLFRSALLLDLLSNGLTYAVLSKGWKRGTLFGGALGLAAVFLPAKLGLGGRQRRLTSRGKWLTVGYYAFGGYVASLARRSMEKRPHRGLLEFVPPSPS